jgi:hypothetical protein
VIALLDREVLRLGLAHDLRGAWTAARGLVEVMGSGWPAAAAPAVSRLDALATLLGGSPAAPLPSEVLEVAWAALPADERHLSDDDPDARVWTAHGVAPDGLATGWSLATAEGWLAAAHPGAAGARLRAAARLVGATCVYDAGRVTVRCPRGLTARLPPG